MLKSKFIAQYTVGSYESTLIDNNPNGLLQRLHKINVTSFEIFRILDTTSGILGNSRNLVFWKNVDYWKVRSTREVDVLEKEISTILNLNYKS